MQLKKQARAKTKKFDAYNNKRYVNLYASIASPQQQQRFAEG